MPLRRRLEEAGEVCIRAWCKDTGLKVLFRVRMHNNSFLPIDTNNRSLIPYSLYKFLRLRKAKIRASKDELHIVALPVG